MVNKYVYEYLKELVITLSLAGKTSMTVISEKMKPIFMAILFVYHFYQYFINKFFYESGNRH